VRYLSSTLLLAVAGSASVFACGGDSGSVSASVAGSGGQAGSIAEGGSGGTVAKGGSAGKGGTSGSAGKGGAGAAGRAGASGTAGGGGTTSEGGAAGEGGLIGVAGEAGAAGAAQQVGSLQVTVNGLPTGQLASVAVAGPGSLSQNVSATKTLSDLALGSYAVSAAPIRVAGAQVDSVFDATVTGSPASVLADATADVGVTYAQRPGTGMMWVTNSNPGGRAALGFSATQLATPGNVTSAASTALALPQLGTGATNYIDGITFSSHGDAWVSYCKGTAVPQVVAKFAPTKLGASGSPTADVVITLPSDTSDDCAAALAFDGSGNLWVGMYRGNVIELNASSLATTGTPAPVVTLTSVDFDAITDMLFDGSGNLFVSAYNKTTIARLSPSQLLASSATLVPDVLITLPTNAGLGGITLDKNGNLWAADFKHDDVIEYNAADLSVSGTPTPKQTFTGVAGPEQLAFDGAGNLWIASYSGNKIVGFAAADIATGGAKTPVTTFTANGALSLPYAIRFNPGAP
jgi:hypothetical protein